LHFTVYSEIASSIFEDVSILTLKVLQITLHWPIRMNMQN